jgi:predicted enzyme related to lactoylglutathione lyase
VTWFEINSAEPAHRADLYAKAFGSRFVDPQANVIGLLKAS